jgi:tRNA (guanine-N7-)-methyltransferase
VNDTPPPQRQLYGRKRGRPLRPTQRCLIKRLLPQLAIGLPAAASLNPAALFRQPPRSVWLEIGYGSGEHLALQAASHPEIGVVGCEVFQNGIAKLLGEIERRRLTNVRLFADDARLLIAALLPASIGRVFVLFPDPWPKARHHKRRIVSNDTLDGFARIMTDGAELRLATDDCAYFSFMLECVTDHRAFEWIVRGAADWRERLADQPPTRYEEKARAAGRVPFFLHVRRRPR